MSELVNEQHRFTIMIAKLLIYAESIGYQVTGGDWYRDYRCNYGKPGSFHKLRLAFDINLFKDGVYLTETEDHMELGIYWEACGGTWGGRFSDNDGNHYSLGEERGWAA